MDENHGDLAGLVWLHHDQLGLDVGIAGVEKAFHVFAGHISKLAGERRRQVSFQPDNRRTHAQRIVLAWVVKLQNWAAVPRVGGNAAASRDLRGWGGP